MASRKRENHALTASLPVVHEPGYSIELPGGHPFPMDKFRVLREHLERTGLVAAGELFAPARVTDEDLHRVHDSGYVAAFRGGDIDERAQRRTGFRWSEALAGRTLLEVGGTLRTVALAVREGLACNTAGGTHHAFPDHGSGYCLLNDIAVAAAAALDHGWARRILVVDLDVHQGDGTAFIFATEPAVFTLSLHGADNFPARKQRSDLDVALPKGTGDDAYLAALNAHLPAVLHRVKPDLVIYDAGVDVHSDDRLGHLDLTDAGLARRDRYVVETCLQAQIPLACVIGGGYDRDLDALAARHAVLHREALGAWRQFLQAGHGLVN